MLQLLKTLIFWLLPPCILFALLATLIGAQIPPPSQSAFDVCRLPCFGGVVPGDTAYGAVPARLQAIFGDAVTLDQMGTPPNAPPTITFTLTYGAQTYEGTIAGNTTVLSIDLQGQIPLIVLIDHLGTPNCVLFEDPIENVSTFMIIQWEKGESIQSAYLTSDDPWNANSTAEQLVLSQSGRRCSDGRLTMRDWAGFRLLWRLFLGD